VDRHNGFRDFVVARGRALLRTAYLLTGEAHLAEDLLQSVLAKVAAKWPRIARDGRPEAYVRTALYREYISWRRRRSFAEMPAAYPPEPAAQADFAEGAARRVTLERALARLTRHQRAVIVLRFYEDHSEAETARLLGCAVGTVKSQTAHALGRLRTLAPELADLFTDTRVEATR
jgi:RNA polymerase sigma-70 factor (sigma-E family)